MSASLQYKIATGERRGLLVRKLGGSFGRTDEFLQITGRLCASLNCFTLHAARSIPRHQRQKLEQLIQYAARPALAISRLSLTTEGLIKYELKTPWKHGKTHIVLSAMEFIEKLVALIPLPRMHLVRYFGVLSPNSKLRKAIIPGKTRAETKKEKEGMTEDE